MPIEKITPFLWFEREAEEAARHYVSIFPNSRIEGITHYGETGPGPEGSVMTVAFVLDGQPFTALNGGPHFRINEAISFVVPCATQKEIDHYWETLGGGDPGQCGCIKDSYGVSWQIVPRDLPKLVGGDDPARSRRVMEAIMGMRKLDLAVLRRAAAG